MYHDPSDSTLSTFTATDGDNLAIQDWPLPEELALRGVVVLVHGLGEHAGRYEQLARRLNSWGFAVRGYDHYGHGESNGIRGCIPVADRLVHDLADVMDSTRARMDPQLPLILFGHSMGGLVAACLVGLGQFRVEGLVLSSPAFDAKLSGFQKLLLSTLPRLAPNFTVGNGLNPDFLTHNRQVVRAYRKDARVHDRISARLARFIADAGRQVQARAGDWQVPTLLMYAGADKLVDPDGSRAFAAAAPAQVVTSRCFGHMYHEIFNEPDAQLAFDLLKRWLDARF